MAFRYGALKSVHQKVTIRITQGVVKDTKGVEYAVSKWGGDSGLIWDLFRMLESGTSPMTVEEIRRDVIQKACRDIAAADGSVPNPSYVYLALLRRRRALGSLLDGMLITEMRKEVQGVRECADEILSALAEVAPNATAEVCLLCDLFKAKQCSFGTNLVRNGSLDSSYEIHEDCPLFKDPLQNGTMLAQFLSGGLNLALEPGIGDVLGACSRTYGRNPSWGSVASPARFHGQSRSAKFRSIVSALSRMNLRLFQMAAKIQSAVGVGKKDDTAFIDGGDSIAPYCIETVEDLHKAKDSSLTEEDAVLRMSMGDLQGMDLRSPKPKRQVIYVLIDCSGSMRNAVVTTRQATSSGVTTRVQAAAVIAAGFIRALEKKGGIAFFGFFSTEIDPRSKLVATDTQEYALVYQMLSRMDTSGGGTDVVSALVEASTEITSARLGAKGGYLGQADVLLITDMESNFESGEVERARIALQNCGAKLHCISLGYTTELEPISEFFVTLTDLAKIDAIAADLENVSGRNSS